MSEERWLPIPGYEGRYDVSDWGRVRSWVPWRGRALPHDLNPMDAFGYKRVMLYASGESRGKSWQVHRLVLLAFVGPRPTGLVSRHLDDDGTNNVLGNLAYGTRSENQYDRVRLGTHHLAIRGSCNHGHPYDEANTRIRRDGGRACRQCARQHTRAYRQRKEMAA